MADIFLNCDLSEHDALPHSTVMQHLHMASLCCREEKMIRNAAEQAEKSTGLPVSTGALFCHPDPQSGHSISVEELKSLLHIQLIRFTSAADLNHVKLDDALFLLIESDEALRSTFLAFIRSRCLISIVCPINSQLERSATALELPIIPEVFVDNHYTDDGVRIIDGMVDQSIALTRLQQVQQYHEFTAEEGSDITLSEDYDHLCVSLNQPVNADTLATLREYLNAL